MPRQLAADVRLTEKQFQGQVVALARLLGWRVQFHWSERHSPAGWPDLTLWRVPDGERPGRFLLAELKADGGKLTKAQACVVHELVQCGLDVHVWWPDDWEYIEETLR